MYRGHAQTMVQRTFKVKQMKTKFTVEVNLTFSMTLSLHADMK